ncbi:anti-sigma-L factor RslA [Kribbella sancticallisti]|uniref:Anti-sigma-L factor RslA n=1 Tax=Kribbella sancticallisti TaxID=460087 RepID=A0ABN2C9E4_9ACTN
MRCPETIAVGAYVLGALAAGERLDLEGHLRDCATCRDALHRFANLPGLLHTLTLEEVTSTAFEDEPLLALAAGVPDSADIPATVGQSALGKPRTSSRRRTLIAAAAVVFVALSGVLVGRELVTDSAPPEQAGVSWSATDGVGGIDTTARLSNESWGTGIQLRMKDLEPGQLCKLVVHARSGESETTGWWTTNYVYAAEVPASTSIALPDIDRIDVVTATGTVLTSLTASSR